MDDNQSMSSHQQSEISISKKSRKEEDPKGAAAMDKKKMKVLKEALREMKAKQEKLTECNSKLTKENQKMKSDLVEKETKNQELFEENHKLHDNILVL